MRVSKQHIWIALGVIFGLTMTVAAMTPTEAIKEREEMMEGILDEMKTLGAIAKKEQPFDAEVVNASAATIAENLKRSADLFPEGSDQGDVPTEAKPEIWTNRDQFDELLAAAEVEAGGAAAGGGVALVEYPVDPILDNVEDPAAGGEAVELLDLLPPAHEERGDAFPGLSPHLDLERFHQAEAVLIDGAGVAVVVAHERLGAAERPLGERPGPSLGLLEGPGRPHQLEDLSSAFGRIIAAVPATISQDLEKINPGRPWRVLLLNRGIVATRSHNTRLMEEAFAVLTRHLPEDAARFFTEGMQQISWRGLTDQALALLDEEPGRLRDWIPAEILSPLHLPPLRERKDDIPLLSKVQENSNYLAQTDALAELLSIL